MIYNIAITFNKILNNEIYNYYKTFSNDLNLKFGLKETSIPHITIVKFKTKKQLSKNELSLILNKIPQSLTINLNGLTILPSSNTGCWIEITINKTKELLELQESILEKLKNYEIKSEINDNFRPHITFGKTIDNDVAIKNIDYSMLTKKQIIGKIEIGLTDKTFEFYKIK